MKNRDFGLYVFAKFLFGVGLGITAVHVLPSSIWYIVGLSFIALSVVFALPVLKACYVK